MTRKTSRIVLAGVVVALGLATYVDQSDLLFGGGCGQGGVAHVFTTDSIAYVLNNYRKDTGTYPTTAQGLPALITAPEGVKNWHGPYLTTKETPLDPWGNEYQYAFPGVNNPESYDVWSFGPHGPPAPKLRVGWELVISNQPKVDVWPRFQNIFKIVCNPLVFCWFSVVIIGIVTFRRLPR